MVPRLLSSVVSDPLWGRQMRFVLGPRQCGKTTLMKSILTDHHSPHFYYNWDESAVRKRYRKDSDFLSADFGSYDIGKSVPWVGFDEIHKFPKWKDVLKGIFDHHEPRIRLIVTGSARLDLMRRVGDSLIGRYFSFRLFPLSLREVASNIKNKPIKPNKNASDFLKKTLSQNGFHQSELDQLLAMSGFPEPMFKGSAVFLRHWQQDYRDRLIRTDLRDLTRIEKLENALYLVDLLAERVGSPLSVHSLREVLEDSYNAIKNYLQGLTLTYATFAVHPYVKKISRGIQKATKVYMFDWTLVKDPVKRFENYVASELNQWVHFWSDTGKDQFELRYIRRRDGRETDFLILREKAPWLLLEAKLKDQPIEGHHYDHAQALGGIPIVQVVKEKNIARHGYKNDVRLSAARLFS